jgi:predicted nucleic acid-binding protein
MISSFETQIERGLDAMLIVYSLLNNHPASIPCEQFIRCRAGWFTTSVTLLEAKAILSKVYAVDSALVSQKLAQFVAGPVVIVEVDMASALAAMNLSDVLGIDLTDAVLVHALQTHSAVWLATDDRKLAQACRQVGITPETPIDDVLRQEMVEWETSRLPAKGLPRLLRRIHHWLNQTYPHVANDFWSWTGEGSHLP